MEQGKAILVVSFGTSYEKARKQGIESIEKEIAEAFPERKFYRAWTSKMILKKIRERDHLEIPNVKEAMEQMAADGITDLLVQPTHILDGIENNRMKDDILSYKEQFSSIHFGTPLLSSSEDADQVVSFMAEEFHLDDDSILVLMGHGTNHKVNDTYTALDRLFKDSGHKNIFVGTVEATPTVLEIVAYVKELHPTKIVLTPLMIVAGDHAHNDMAGDDPDSWINLFRRDGHQVETVLKGLGEYSGIRKLFVKHAKAALQG